MQTNFNAVTIFAFIKHELYKLRVTSLFTFIVIEKANNKVIIVRSLFGTNHVYIHKRNALKRFLQWTFLERKKTLEAQHLYSVSFALFIGDGGECFGSTRVLNIFSICLNIYIFKYILNYIYSYIDIIFFFIYSFHVLKRFD